MSIYIQIVYVMIIWNYPAHVQVLQFKIMQWENTLRSVLQRIIPRFISILITIYISTMREILRQITSQGPPQHTILIHKVAPEIFEEFNFIHQGWNRLKTKLISKICFQMIPANTCNRTHPGLGPRTLPRWNGPWTLLCTFISSLKGKSNLSQSI